MFFVFFLSTLFAEAPKISSNLSMQEINKFKAENPSDTDQFGYSVSISGNTAVVGAFGSTSDSGTAYVYEYDEESSLFIQIARLRASNPTAGDYFGLKVAISGDTIVVGAHRDDHGGLNSGAAYIFEKPLSGWVTTTETAKITASDATSGDAFGYGIAIDEDTIVIGASVDEGVAPDSGSAYIFEKPLFGWTTTTETAKITASDAERSDFFGTNVAISGDTIVVGVRSDDDAGTSSGSAYIFAKPLSGWVTSTETAKITASDAAEDNFFAHSIDVSGDTIVVGAFRNDEGGTYSGSAYIFEKPLSGWVTSTETAKITASDAAENDYFGISVTISADTIVVGAYGDYENGSFSGSAYIFEKSISGWVSATETARITASDATSSNAFGYSVAISGDTIVVGAAGDGGSAYIYKTALTLNSIENKTDVLKIKANDKENDPISFSIQGGDDASLFDIDATTGLLSFRTSPDFENPSDKNRDNIYKFTLKLTDEFDEYRFYNTYINISDIEYEGKVPDALSFKELNTLKSDNPSDNDMLGYSVSISNKIAVVGAYGYNSNAGTAYVYEYDETSKLFIKIARFRAYDSVPGGYFGYSVAISGDTIVVGTYGNSGSAYIFEKPLSGWATSTETAKITASDAAENDNFAYSVAISGDTIIVGASSDDNVGNNSGSAYIFEKPISGWVSATETAKITASDAAENDLFGFSVAISADTIVVAALRDGSAYIFEKPLSGWVTATETAKITASDIATNDFFGLKIAISGDTIVVGAYADDDSGSASGSAYIFEKSLSGWVTTTETAKITASDAAEDDYFGSSVAISGDIIVIGAYQDDDNGLSSGSAYIFKKSLSGWVSTTETAKITAFDGAENDSFGTSVAISGDTIIIGAPNAEDDGDFDTGSAYIFKPKSSSSFSISTILYLLN